MVDLVASSDTSVSKLFHLFPQVKEIGASMLELWSLMDTPVHDQQMFAHITCNIAAEENEITTPGCLSLETLEQVIKCYIPIL